MNDSDLETIDTPLWKPLLLFGFLMTAIGCAAMSLSWATALAVELLVGAAMLAAGFVQALLAFQSRSKRGVALIGLSALFFIVGGTFLLMSPVEGIRTISLLIAILFVIEGVGKIIWALRMSIPLNRGMLILEGLAGTAIGLFFWANWPGDAAWMIGLLVGIRFVFAGLTSVWIGWAMRPSNI